MTEPNSAILVDFATVCDTVNRQVAMIECLNWDVLRRSFMAHAELAQWLETLEGANRELSAEHAIPQVVAQSFPLSSHLLNQTFHFQLNGIGRWEV